MLRSPSSNGDQHRSGTPKGNKRTVNELLSPLSSSSELNISKRLNFGPLDEMGKADNKKDLVGITINVPTSNKFSALNSDLNIGNIKNPVTSNSKNADKHLKKIKIPPLTVVGATNFSSAIKIVNDIAKNEFFLKYMSIGVKIQLSTLEHYNTIKEKLLNDKIEFYSHDINPEKYEQFILSGINKVDINDLKTELTASGFNVASINEIAIKKPRFLDEGLYRVTFTGPIDTVKLYKTRLNHTIVKWKRKIFENKLTQCRRCQNFGHGSRNCNVAFKCGICSGLHETSACSVEAVKCANCNGEHNAKDLDCPKRKSFMEMRQKMSVKNNKIKSKMTIAPPRLDSPLIFPELSSNNKKDSMNGSTRNNDTSHQWPFVNKTTFNSMARPASNKTDQPMLKNAENADDLFTPHEISTVLNAVLQGLKKCKSKEEQLQLMFEIAAQYIYGQP